MKKFFIYLITIYLSLVFLMPKSNLWFSFERFLKKESLIVSKERVRDFWAFCDIKNGELYFDDLKVAKIGDIKIFPYLFYNLVLTKEVVLSKEVRNIANFNIKSMKIYQSVLKPFYIFIKGEGNLGKFHGFMDIKKRVVKIFFSPFPKYKNDKFLRRFFKKSKEGFVYEYSFK